MKHYPLQLNQVLIHEVACKAAALGTKEFAKTINVTTNPTFGRGDDIPLQWMVSLQVHFKAGEGESHPLQYTGHLHVSGFFTMEAGATEEAVLRIVAVNCPSMLYATARETISSLTARGPHGVLLLPTVTFSDQTLSPTEPAKTKSEPAPEKSPAKARTRG